MKILEPPILISGWTVFNPIWSEAFNNHLLDLLKWILSSVQVGNNCQQFENLQLLLLNLVRSILTSIHLRFAKKVPLIISVGHNDWHYQILQIFFLGWLEGFWSNLVWSNLRNHSWTCSKGSTVMHDELIMADMFKIFWWHPFVNGRTKPHQAWWEAPTSTLLRFLQMIYTLMHKQIIIANLIKIFKLLHLS